MVAGGDNYPQDVSRVVELYDLTSDTWRLLPPLSGSLTGSPALITAGQKTYLLGGYGEVTIVFHHVCPLMLWKAMLQVVRIE